MNNLIVQNFEAVKQNLPKNVKLVAVSKTKPKEDIETLYQKGQRIFGENRVEELVTKFKELPKDIEWHMIGHLQSKKVKKIAPFISLIHSIDSLKLLIEVNKEAKKNNRVIDCLLQFHIAKEESKYGFTEQEGIDLINSAELKKLKNIQIKGVMGMATFTSNQELLASEFKKLAEISKLTSIIIPGSTEISMGMSGDYLLAIQNGSTIIRVGSTIFGSRN